MLGNNSAFKLFGMTIQMGFESNEDSIVIATCASSSDQEQSENRGIQKGTIEDSMVAEQTEEPTTSSTTEATPSTITENLKTSSNDKASSYNDLSKKDDQSDQTSSTQSQDQSPLKKPDKILPCPRCNSMDTKFCYFNNYNVNQPRHFCKKCQRYWTAGGTMRNVPVGAGRRKNKNSSVSLHHQLTISDPSNGLIEHALSPNSTILAFGSDSNELFSTNGKENSGSISNGDLNAIKKGGNGGNVTSQVMQPQVACFQGSSWPYAWNPIAWQSGFPVSFYSTPPHWACNSPATWNAPLLPSPSGCLDQSSTTSSPMSPSLGKHSRDGTILRSTNSKENPSVLIPKTLRINDPAEAAKSSIWDTLGIKNAKVGSSEVVGGFFRGLQQAKVTDHDDSNCDHSVEGSSMVLQANPAALSRSLSFHEIRQ